MGIFGEFSAFVREKPKERLEDIINKHFDDPLLIAEIHKYLSMRRQMRNLPTKISFNMQLEVLKKYPPQLRAEVVRNSTTCGYLSLAYAPKKILETKEAPIQKEKEDIIKEVSF